MLSLSTKPPCHARPCAGIHAFALAEPKDVDGRDKPGHDASLTEFFSVALV
jgi:hypothetical protein